MMPYWSRSDARRPSRVVAERVRRLDLRRHPGVDVPVRVGLAGVVRVRREQDAEFHAVSSLRRLSDAGPLPTLSRHVHCEAADRAGRSGQPPRPLPIVTGCVGLWAAPPPAV